MSTNEISETKEYGGYLVINWRDDDVRYRKTPPENPGPQELAIPLELTINVPEVQVPTIEAAIDVPAAKVEQSVIDETRELAAEQGVVEDE